MVWNMSQSVRNLALVQRIGREKRELNAQLEWTESRKIRDQVRSRSLERQTRGRTESASKAFSRKNCQKGKNECKREKAMHIPGNIENCFQIWETAGKANAELSMRSVCTEVTPDPTKAPKKSTYKYSPTTQHHASTRRLQKIKENYRKLQKICRG